MVTGIAEVAVASVPVLRTSLKRNLTKEEKFGVAARKNMAMDFFLFQEPPPFFLTVQSLRVFIPPPPLVVFSFQFIALFSSSDYVTGILCHVRVTASSEGVMIVLVMTF